MEANYRPPWERHDAFPEKPTDSDYGYVLRGKPVPCSQGELIRRGGSQDIPQIELVWHPGAARMVPAGEPYSCVKPSKHGPRAH
jgi:hypothetical protein